MASDPFARRVFPCSLLASVSIHTLVVLSLMSVWRSVTFGPGNSAGYVAGVWGAVPEPEIFFGDESLDPADTPDGLPGDQQAESSPQPEALAVSGSFDPPDVPDSAPDENDAPTAESSADPDALSFSEPADPTDTDNSLNYTNDPTTQSERPIEAKPPELVSLNGSQNSRLSGRGPVAAQGASFFGTVAEGQRFVYLVDNSPSMNLGRGRAHGEVSRLIRAFGELKASVGRLSAGQSFYVILFNGQTRRMFDDHSTPPRFFPATPGNKRRLETWLATVGTGEATDPLPALRMGLEMQPSSLFLLSDGVFTVKDTAIAEFIDRHNIAGAPIHTVAYEDERSCQTMWRIAFATGGEYRFVESPARAREREESEAADAWARRRRGEEMRGPPDPEFNDGRRPSRE